MLGTLLFLEGLKLLARWAQLDAVLPVFGLVETTAVKVAVLTALGIAYLAAGAAVLRLHRHAKPAVLGVLSLSTLSLAISWPVLPDAIARAQLARREMQGLPIREGEIEAMQAMFPAIAAGAIVLSLLLVWFARTRPAL